MDDFQWLPLSFDSHRSNKRIGSPSDEEMRRAQNKRITTEFELPE